MQALDESRIEGLKEVWEGYIRLEAKLNTDAQTHLDSMIQAVQAVDASVDSAIFVRTHRTPWSTPLDLPFESSTTFNDTVSHLCRLFYSAEAKQKVMRKLDLTSVMFQWQIGGISAGRQCSCILEQQADEVEKEACSDYCGYQQSTQGHGGVVEP
jgi:hypothetical protein